ncbi:MAG TPA: hypothetical protein VMS93_01035 [Candidatus Saccharimonadales bacterium]|nr:hypothetical protein [Candidatus Saccharimonadales bacterium]
MTAPIRAHGPRTKLGRLFGEQRASWVRNAPRHLGCTAIDVAMKVFRPGRTFQFRGRTYPYAYAVYNHTLRNERCVEIPVVWELIRGQAGGRVLEVGNVLSHYFAVNHVVVDKYEKCRGVLNADLMDFRPSERFDLIVSISTLEHVGWDEETRDPPKLLRAVEHLRSLLNPGGQLVYTSALGYNQFLDESLRGPGLPHTEVHYLLRTAKYFGWRPATFDEVMAVRYGHPFPGGNAVMIAYSRAD